MLSKLLSGRWILTIAAAFVFVYLSVKAVLTPAEAVTIIMFVFQSYFNKNNKQEEVK